MTSVAGKKPQDIYDNGASQAAEIEQFASESMKKQSTTAHSARQMIEKDVHTRLDQKSTEIVKELNQAKSDCIERLKQTIATEVQDTNAHLGQVTKDLENLSTRLKRQIANLKVAHSEDIKTLTQNLSGQFEAVNERAHRDVEKREFDATGRLRAKGTIAVSNVQQKLDQSLWETRGEERQYNSAFFKNFMKQANSIDAHFSALMQELSEDFDKHNKILQAQAEKSDADLKKESELQARQIKTQESKYEREIRDFFNHESVEHSNRLDNSLNSVTHELSTMHDVTTNKLSEQTETLSNNLHQASSDVRATLSEKCTQLTDHLKSSTHEFKARLTERTNQSQTMKEGLEDEKKKLFAALKNDLTSIKDTFEKRLEKMVVTAVEKVAKVGQDAEEGINLANEKCLEDLKNTGHAAKGEVDDTVAEFLRIISEQRLKALEEIAKAAGVTEIYSPESSDIKAPQFKERVEHSASANIDRPKEEQEQEEEESQEVQEVKQVQEVQEVEQDDYKEAPPAEEASALNVPHSISTHADAVETNSAAESPTTPTPAPEGRIRRRRNYESNPLTNPGTN